MASLGAQLKQAREQRGVGLDEIAQTTKISTRFLRAMEADRYDQLPGGIFNKGFIRAYARAVGVDEEAAVAEYLAATEPSPAKTESTGPTENRRVELRAEAESPASGELPWGAFAIVLVLAALGLAGWGFYSGQSRQASKLPAPATPASAPSLSPGTAAPSNVASSSTTAPQPGPAKLPVNKPGQPAETKPKSPAAALTEPGATATHYFTVRVNVREDSWLAISADGKPVLQGNFLAPAQKSVKAIRQVVEQTGNAGGTDFEFNGQALPNPGQPGEVKTLIFGAEGLEAVQAASRPTTPQP